MYKFTINLYEDNNDAVLLLIDEIDKIFDEYSLNANFYMEHKPNDDSANFEPEPTEVSRTAEAQRYDEDNGFSWGDWAEEHGSGSSAAGDSGVRSSSEDTDKAYNVPEPDGTALLHVHS